MQVTQITFVPFHEVQEILKGFLPSHREELAPYGDFFVFLATEGQPEKLVQVEVFLQVLEVMEEYPGDTFGTNLMPFEQIIECVGEKVGVPFVIFHDVAKNRMIYIGLKTYFNGLLKEVADMPEIADD